MRLLISIPLMIMLLGIQSASLSLASPGKARFSIVPSYLKPYDVNSRAYFTYSALPGMQLSDHIHVTNDGSARGSIHFYVSDAITAPMSGTSFLPEGAPRHDVGAWITLSQTQVTLDPGQSEEVAFILTIPNHVRPGQHGGVILAKEIEPLSYMRSAKLNSVSIKIQASLGIGVLINLPGPTVEKLTTQGIRYDNEYHYQRLIIALANTGTQLLYPSGYLHVLNDQGRLVQNLRLQLDTFVPQTSISYPANIQNKPLSPGKRYIAILYLHYGNGYVLQHKTDFLVPLSSKNSVVKLIQDLGAPVAAVSDNSLSQFVSWRLVIVLSILFFVGSSLFFWGQKISKLLARVRNKKRG